MAYSVGVYPTDVSFMRRKDVQYRGYDSGARGVFPLWLFLIV